MLLGQQIIRHLEQIVGRNSLDHRSDFGQRIETPIAQKALPQRQRHILGMIGRNLDLPHELPLGRRQSSRRKPLFAQPFQLSFHQIDTPPGITVIGAEIDSEQPRIGVRRHRRFDRIDISPLLP